MAPTGVEAQELAVAAELLGDGRRQRGRADLGGCPRERLRRGGGLRVDGRELVGGGALVHRSSGQKTSSGSRRSRRWPSMKRAIVGSLLGSDAPTNQLEPSTDSHPICSHRSNIEGATRPQCTRGKLPVQRCRLGNFQASVPPTKMTSASLGTCLGVMPSCTQKAVGQPRRCTSKA